MIRALSGALTNSAVLAAPQKCTVLAMPVIPNNLLLLQLRVLIPRSGFTLHSAWPQSLLCWGSARNHLCFYRCQGAGDGHAGERMWVTTGFMGDWVARMPMAALVAVMIMESSGTFIWASLHNLRGTQKPPASTPMRPVPVIESDFVVHALERCRGAPDWPA